MQNITLVAVGKLKEKFYVEACNEYIKRLSGFCRIEVKELSEQKNDGNEASVRAELKRESEDIKKAIPSGAFVIAMCVEGIQYSTPELTDELARRTVAVGGKLCVIIGGSEGLDETIKQLADLKLSMSKMTFPHHLARVMVLEQLYRCHTILAGKKYHK